MPCLLESSFLKFSKLGKVFLRRQGKFFLFVLEFIFCIGFSIFKNEK